MPAACYFTATPHGWLSVVVAVSGVRLPVEGVTEYCDKDCESKLVTKSQLSSERIAIDVGLAPVATVAGFPGAKPPDTVEMRNIETVLEPVPTT
jgi:hypothetical protein